MTQSGAAGNSSAAAILYVFLLAAGATSVDGEGSLTPYESRTEFLLTSPASTSSGLYGYVNPALLAYVDEVETVLSWSDESGGRAPVIPDWGIFGAIPHLGFGVIHRELQGEGFNDYRLAAASGDRSASVGFAYGWSGGDRRVAPESVLVLGALLRPSPRISLGLTWTSTPSLDAREGVGDPALRPLMARIAVREDPELTRRFPEVMESRFELITKSGKRLTAQAQYPKGHIRNPMSDADVEIKFRSACAPHLSAAQCDTALGLLWRLDELDDIGNLLGAFSIQ